MDSLSPALLRRTVSANVADSLTEDVGEGDLTAQLIPAQQRVSAQVITREFTIMAGRPWAEEVFRQVDPAINVEWQASDGEAVSADAVLLTLSGPARALMTAERAALNWLQTLSGVATRCRRYADRVAHTKVRLLDTRKTLPGLRLAQKYAVRCGGCHNHRFGLFDAFLIKENHIAACGSITRAIEEARRIAPERPVEVEAETPEELDEAVRAGADIVMLDEFSLEDTSAAVQRYGNRVTLEASGGITESNLATIAETGVHCISLGTLTKDVTAIDLSLRVLHQE